jgi:hypothetical protein
VYPDAPKIVIYPLKQSLPTQNVSPDLETTVRPQLQPFHSSLSRDTSNLHLPFSRPQLRALRCLIHDHHHLDLSSFMKTPRQPSFTAQDGSFSPISSDSASHVIKTRDPRSPPPSSTRTLVCLFQRIQLAFSTHFAAFYDEFSGS